jgi:hypothetical protein
MLKYLFLQQFLCNSEKLKKYESENNITIFCFTYHSI